MDKLLKENVSFHHAAVFDDTSLIWTNWPHISADDLKLLRGLFASRDTAIASGFNIAGTHYDLHRWYDSLVYGRDGDGTDVSQGAGIALAKGVVGGKRTVYVLINYKFPTVSAKAVSELRDFVTNIIEPGKF